MARMLTQERVIPPVWPQTCVLRRSALQDQAGELNRRLLWLIAARTLILLLGLNLARPLGILPDRLGPFPFVPCFNFFAVTLAFGYLVLWWNRWRPLAHLNLQIAVDLCIATMLVGHTHGSESPFVSFYLLIIIYCSLTLGRNGGVIGAALSTILYAGIISLGHMGVLPYGGPPAELSALSFRISLHVLGFFSVALLGANLSQRLRVVQAELQQKINSFERLQKLTEHIVSSIRSGLLTTDLDGNITLSNDAAEELTEKARADIIHHSICEVIGEGLWNRIRDADLFRDARPLRHEEWLVPPRGHRRFLGYSVSPLMDHERTLIGYIISFQNLTDIKRLEEEVRIRDRMAAIGRMAAAIAHEIRNPLAAMRGSVEVLRSHLVLGGADTRLLDILIRESDRLNKFVEEFLDFARPTRCVRQPLDLAPLLQDSVTLLKNSPAVLERHRVELYLASRQILIDGDADRLKQVFWNLAQNALRAMPAGGTLQISARNEEDGGGQIVFEDNGTGMTEEERAQLFQPLHSGFAGGTGLGLSVVFQIVEDHQGKIRFESEKGRGTRVTLYLPPAAH